MTKKLNNPNAENNLRKYRPGESGNPKGRPRKLSKQIAEIPNDAQSKIYAVLHEAIRASDKEEAAKVLATAEGLEYGFILQLASKELLGGRGWTVLNDILDRLFGRPTITTENNVKTNMTGRPMICFRACEEEEPGLSIGFGQSDNPKK